MNLMAAGNLHFPMAVGGARYKRSPRRSLGASIPIQLTVDTPIMTVGRESHFRIVGAPPSSQIYWSSYKNGKATGELNAGYGQFTEANGTAELAYTPAAGDVGNWTKEILVQDGAGSNYTAIVQYTVAAAASTLPATTSTTPTRQGNFLDNLTKDGFFIGNTFIPYLYAAAGGLAFFLFLKRR